MSDTSADKLYRHYRGSNIDALLVAEKWGLGAPLFSALKYIQRAGKKEGENSESDMLKAVWYLTYETARNTFDHEDRLALADTVTNLLRHSVRDGSCPTETVASLGSSDSQYEIDFPFVEADHSHGEFGPTDKTDSE